MSQPVPRPKRDPVVGEIVLYLPNGDPTEEPVGFHVQCCRNGNVDGYYFELNGSPLPIFKRQVKHLHAEYWDAFDAVELLRKRALNGAFLLHPIWGPIGNKILAAANARAARGQAEDEESEQEVEA